MASVNKKVTSDSQSQTVEKKVRGLKANIAGRDYEQKVANYYIKNGWKKIEMHKKVKGYDIDVYGSKTTDEGVMDYVTVHLLVECKNKVYITKADVMNFEKTLSAFGKPKQVKAILAYTGGIDKSVVEALKGFKPTIHLKHLPL